MRSLFDIRMEALLILYGERYLNHADALRLWNKKEKYHFVTHASRYKDYMKKGSILFLGCGIGHQVWAFREFGFDTYGCDISEYAIKNAITSNCVCCNIIKMPYKNRQFDNVVGFDIMEHIPMDWLDDALKEIMRVTNKMFFTRIPYDTKYAKRTYKLEDVLTEHMINQPEEWWREQFRKHFKGWKETIKREEGTDWRLYKYELQHS